MTQDAIAAACQGEILVPAAPDTTVTAGYTSDMLSDVMANAPGNAVLITIQNHNNTIAVSTLADVRLIVICHGRPIPEDMLKTARNEKIGLIVTNLSQYEATCAIGRLLPPPAREG